MNLPSTVALSKNLLTSSLTYESSVYRSIIDRGNLDNLLSPNPTNLTNPILAADAKICSCYDCKEKKQRIFTSGVRDVLREAKVEANVQVEELR